MELIINAMQVHHDPELLGEDAKDFKPGRVANAAKKPPNSFLPFGLGTRICIGYLLEIAFGQSQPLPVATDHFYNCHSHFHWLSP